MAHEKMLACQPGTAFPTPLNGFRERLSDGESVPLQRSLNDALMEIKACSGQ